ncbi:MAG: XdhC family protein [Deltaproteobacteria bacterium]|nr:XdhC family protein [Deltaproteobacteria bacterium]
MQKLYQKLLLALQDGQEALLITEIGPSGPKRTLSLEAKDINFYQKQLIPNCLLIEKNGLKFIVEKFTPRSRLIVFGGGHVSLALAPLAPLLEYELHVYDDRPSFANPARFPMAAKTYCEPFDQLGANIVLRSSDYVVIVTRGHKHDEDCLEYALCGEEPSYLGMIGSKRRIAIVKKLLSDKGLSSERLEKLKAPIGVEIGAVTPAEIAISIAAQLVQVRRSAEKTRGLGDLEVFPDIDLIKYIASPHQEGAALVTVVATSGSTPRKAGAKMVTIFDGRTVGSIGGGCAEAEILTEARQLIGTGAQKISTIDMTDKAEEDGMVCGGHMTALIEDLGD